MSWRISEFESAQDYTSLIRVAQSIAAKRVLFSFQDKQGCAAEFFRVAHSLDARPESANVRP